MIKKTSRLTALIKKILVHLQLNMDRQQYVSSDAENVIIFDADYIDKLSFDLIVNFERMINRPLANADMARWIECVALDGGLREGDNHTLVVVLHNKQTKRLKNFVPSAISSELDGQAFKSHLGEFEFAAVPTEDVADMSMLAVDMVSHFCYEHKAHRIMVVTDMNDTIDELRTLLRNAPDEKRITLFGMEPLPTGNYRTEILGYSLMNALGIKAEEIKS